jgi:hypothetical protein
MSTIQENAQQLVFCTNLWGQLPWGDGVEVGGSLVGQL